MNTSATPRLEDVIMQGVNYVLDGVHTCLPGKVVSVKSSGLVNVQPLLKIKTISGTDREFPVIPSVPVVWPSTAGGMIRFPLAADDPVLLVFSERGIENWIENGALSVSDSGRFALKDAFAIPGVRGKGNALAPKGASTSAEFSLGDARVELTNAGTVKVQAASAGKIAIGNGTIELVALLDTLLDDLINLTTTNAVVGSPCLLSPATIAQLQIVKTQLGALKQ